MFHTLLSYLNRAAAALEYYQYGIILTCVSPQGENYRGHDAMEWYDCHMTYNHSGLRGLATPLRIHG